MLLAIIIDKGVWEVVTFIFRVIFTTFFFPVVVRREESVGLCGGIVYLRQAETVRYRQCLLINTGTTYYIYIFLRGAVLQGFFKRCIGITAREFFLHAAQNDVPAVGQGTLRQR